jgi:DNA-binding MarR family transcriptional regulator
MDSTPPKGRALRVKSSKPAPLQPIPLDVGKEVQGRCLCFQTQRAARRLARRFDVAFSHLGITNQQFSLMMMLNNAGGPNIGRVADFLAMDRTTLTAALKALQGPGLVAVARDPDDLRVKRVSLTAAGGKLLQSAIPIWRAEHAKLETELPGSTASDLRAALANVA